MSKKIIYISSEGTLVILHPTEEVLLSKTIEEVAKKDVPFGLSYKIVDESYLPSDRTFRNAWEVDPVILVDGEGDTHNMFLDDPSHPDYVAPVEVSE